MNSISHKYDFNPSGVGLKNGNFIGLPFTESSANVVLLPVPWDVTVSYREGTALAPQAILDASVQLDLFDADVKDAWKLGIFMHTVDANIIEARNRFRPKATDYIHFLETGGLVSENAEMETILKEVNFQCSQIHHWVYHQCKKLLDAGKMVGIIGGDHSVPLGFLKAIAEKYDSFAILQIDAHHDLRGIYEGFEYSHASIFYNALQIKEISKLVQVGIRDYCKEEVVKAEKEANRILVFYDQYLKENGFTGMNWNEQCDIIISTLPQMVYVSFDIDGLNPGFCPNTGTPVPGGIDFAEIVFLLKKLVDSGRRIIGFDLCEVGNNEWDANVGARLVYKICNLMGKSQKRI
jgi:agmatinase